jgi:hypothetical protein
MVFVCRYLSANEKIISSPCTPCLSGRHMFLSYPLCHLARHSLLAISGLATAAVPYAMRLTLVFHNCDSIGRRLMKPTPKRRQKLV